MPDSVVVIPEAKAHQVDLGPNQALIQITLPDDSYSEERVKRLAKWASETHSKLNDKPLFVVTPESVKLQVHRPRSVLIDFSDTHIEGEELLKKLREAIEDTNTTDVKVLVRGCHVTR